MAGPKTRPQRSEGFSTVLFDANANDMVLVLLKYDDVQKYGGLKLALYDQKVWEKIDKSALDPHFYPDEAGPVARFEPTERGVMLGLRAMGIAKDMVTQATFARIMHYNKGKK